ncbi:hypothetical protein D3C86_1660510 [compost metagenome]
MFNVGKAIELDTFSKSPVEVLRVTNSYVPALVVRAPAIFIAPVNLDVPATSNLYAEITFVPTNIPPL